MNNPTYKKYGELPRKFHSQFDAAYLQFWKKRGMNPPEVQWRKQKEDHKKRELQPPSISK